MKSDIEKLHKIDLNIVKSIINICDNNNLKYYIIGGTLLGALRHKGFIPWDDDVDLAMPRNDYEKFLKIAQQKLDLNLKVINFRTDPSYHYYITRILNTDVKVIENRITDEEKYTYASVDIFPIDGTPNIKILRNVYYFRVMLHRALMSLCYKSSIDRKRKRSKKENNLLAIMEKVPIEKLTNANREKEKIDKLLRKNEVSQSNFIGTIMGAYRTREIVPKEYFGEGKFYDFDGISLRGPIMYNEYLTHMYGDYMKLPPIEDRKTHFKIFEINDDEDR